MEKILFLREVFAENGGQAVMFGGIRRQKGKWKIGIILFAILGLSTLGFAIGVVTVALRSR